MKILILDDEQRMLDLFEVTLSFYGFHIKTTTCPVEAEKAIKTGGYQLVLLDIMMPKMDGIQFCQQVRQYSSVPIIMITALSEKEDIVRGFEAGADDYITKPFVEEILLARIHAVTKRIQDKRVMIVDGLTVDKENIYVGYLGKEISLTPIEYRIIHLFVSNPNRVFSREQLKVVLYRNDEKIDNRTVDSHIRNLRDKLRKATFDVDKYLITVYGYGYRWQNVE